MIRRERKPDINPRMSGHSHLSPWDMSGLGYGFGLYRPRRPSYTFATQTQRARSESYRYAVRKSTSDLGEAPDFIEGIISKNRKESYIRATRDDPGIVEMQSIELPETDPQQYSASSPNLTDGDSRNNFPGGASNVVLPNQNNHSETSAQFTRVNGTQAKPKTHLAKASSENHIQELKAAVSKKRFPPSNNSSPASNHSPANKRVRKKSMAAAMKANDIDEYQEDSSVFASDQQEHDQEEAGTPCSSEEPPFPTGPFKRFRFRKNLLFLCLSFILIFSAFRAIQNLQSSLNAQDSLGIVAMTCVHGTMCLTCLWAPVIINNVTAKWTLVLGMFSFILWIAANFFPRFYTLIPFGIIAGVGQGILWTAESSYILKLAFDSSRLNKDGIEREMFRFHGLFIACFQTTHIWGNLISSLVLHSAKNALNASKNTSLQFAFSDGGMDLPATCGVLYPCKTTSQTDVTKDVPSTLYKLMSAYIALGFVAFFLVMLCLDRIGARVTPEKSGYLIVVEHVSMMLTHKTFRLLIPLLIFSGLQQAFIYSDFNQAYVACKMGEEYIGYCMIILGLANVFSAVLVAVCANLIPREFIFGVGGIIHMGLMIGLLIWLPSKSLAIFFVLSASWGFCDAVWQTQCNTLICITCPEDTDVAFANYRMLQSFGLTIGFLSGTFMCVSFKLYILMILLVVAIMFYVLAEYRVRQVDGDLFEGQIEVN